MGLRTSHRETSHRKCYSLFHLYKSLRPYSQAHQLEQSTSSSKLPPSVLSVLLPLTGKPSSLHFHFCLSILLSNSAFARICSLKVQTDCDICPSVPSVLFHPFFFLLPAHIFIKTLKRHWQLD